eukprot:Opistho-2@62475
MAQRSTKVAIKHEKNPAIFYEFDHKQSLTQIVRDVCMRFSVAAEQYALYCEDSGLFLTEENRTVRDGMVLELKLPPGKEAAHVIETLKSADDATKKKAMFDLRNQLKQSEFCAEFERLGGIGQLVAVIESTSGGTLGYALMSFRELMDHGTEEWSVLSDTFVKKVLALINSQNTNICRSALAIAERLIDSPRYGFERVFVSLPLDLLVQSLESADVGVQQNAMALVTSVLETCPISRLADILGRFNALGLRKALLTLLRGAGGVNDELGHQLYVIQTIMLNIAQERRNRRFDRAQGHQELVAELFKIAFPDSTDSSMQGTKLGFSNPDVSTHFSEPPGILALECMLFVAKKYQEVFRKLALEQTGRADVPFGVASIALTNVLCEVLNVGGPSSEHSTAFEPMLFSCDNAFEEFFGVCVQLLHRTWREMDAGTNDLAKVLVIVRKQIDTVMNTGVDRKPQTMDSFKNAVFGLTYKAILAQQEKEMAGKESFHAKAEPVKHLREKVGKENLIIISEQRIAYLLEGEFFSEVRTKGASQGDAVVLPAVAQSENPPLRRCD